MAEWSGSGLPPVFPVTPPPLDLDQCAAEPIRTPGVIQPHGWLLAYRVESGKLAAYSTNFETLTGLVPGDPQTAVLQGVVDEMRARISNDTSTGAPVSLGLALIEGRFLDATHAFAGALRLVEFEPASDQRGTQGPMYGLARRFVPSLQRATSVPELAALATAEMKRLTGFGRCLVYSFDPDGHGCVLAERADEGYDSYLGHRFPSTDIPSQARELYLLNHIRLIPDANYLPVGLHFVGGPVDADPLDLSYAQLRSVSPVHLEYMRNMGTLASMSVSIVVRGRLWGLISCHDFAPHDLGLEVRLACEHLGGLLALQIEAKEDHVDVETRLRLRTLGLQIIAPLGDSDASLHAITEQPELLLDIAHAGGAAVVFKEQCWHVGITPADEEVLALSDWILQRELDVYSTDDLASAGAPVDPGHGHAGGVLAIVMSRVERHLVIWFRPEQERTVRWAGEKFDTQPHLHPRTSFSSWEEIVRGSCAAWSPSVIVAVTELRQSLVGIVLHRVQERDAAEVRLGLVTLARQMAEQADSAKTHFLAVLAHELRTPLAAIAVAAELIASDRLPPARISALGQLIKRNVAVEARLIDDLLDLSAIIAGKLSLAVEPVDIDAVVLETVEVLGSELAAKELRLSIDTEPARIGRAFADPVRIQQVLWNILRNAVKFTPRGGEIRLMSRIEGSQWVVTCTDSGVGIDTEALARIFIAYEQAGTHTHQRFGGLGLGLAIAKGIVESHGGQLTAESAGVNQGATFTLRLPLGFDADAGTPTTSAH